MDWKKLGVLGVILWIVASAEIIILNYGFHIWTGLLFNIINFSIIALLSILCSAYYFKEKRIFDGLEEGVLLGFFFVVISVILDLVIYVPIFIKSYSYFILCDSIIKYLIILVSAAVVGRTHEESLMKIAIRPARRVIRSA